MTPLQTNKPSCGPGLSTSQTQPHVANVYGVSLWGAENALKLDNGGDCTTVNTRVTEWVPFAWVTMTYEIYFNNTIKIHKYIKHYVKWLNSL